MVANVEKVLVALLVTTPGPPGRACRGAWKALVGLRVSLAASQRLGTG